jgi:hypothetical protein
MRRANSTAIVILATLGLAALPGCFEPSLDSGFRCGAEVPGPVCPDGFSCVVGHCERTADVNEGYLGLFGPDPQITRLGGGSLLVLGDERGGARQLVAQRLDVGGAPVEEVVTLSEGGYDPDSVKVAGGNPTAVVAWVEGQSLRFAFVGPTGTPEIATAPRAAGELPMAFTPVAEGDDVCLIWSSRAERLSLVCTGSGTSRETPDLATDALEWTIVEIAAAMAPGGGLTVGWRADGPAQRSWHFALPADRTGWPLRQPLELGGDYDTPGEAAELLQAAVLPSQGLAIFGWLGLGGIHIAQTDNQATTLAGTNLVADTAGTYGFALAASDLTGAGAEVRALALRSPPGGGGPRADLVVLYPPDKPAQAQAVDTGGAPLTAPRALPRPGATPLFFFHAAIRGASSGDVYTVTGDGVPPQVWWENMGVAPDYAVTAAPGGGIYVFYRENLDALPLASLLDGFGHPL